MELPRDITIATVRKVFADFGIKPLEKRNMYIDYTNIAGEVNHRMYGNKIQPDNIARDTVSEVLAYGIFNCSYNEIEDLGSRFTIHKQVHSYKSCGVEGCILGLARIEVLCDDGVHKTIDLSSLCPGDMVLTGDGTFQRVSHVLKSDCSTNFKDCYELHGVVLTSGHPVRQYGAKDVDFIAVMHHPDARLYIGPVQEHGLYDLIIPGAQSVVTYNESRSCPGVECLTLGHGIMSGVAAHEFLGDMDRVQDALKSQMKNMSPTPTHVIEVRYVRNPATGFICDIVNSVPDTSIPDFN